MHRILKLFETALDGLSGVAFGMALIINASNVVGRYVFHSPIYWAEEVTTLLVIWSVCLMSYRLTLRGENLSAEILSAFLPAAANRWLQFVLALAGMVICAYFALYAYKVVALVASISQVTTVAEIPKQYVNGTILVAFALAVLGSAIRCVALLDPKSPLLSHEPVEVQDALAG